MKAKSFFMQARSYLQKLRPNLDGLNISPSQERKITQKELNDLILNGRNRHRTPLSHDWPFNSSHHNAVWI